MQLQDFAQYHLPALERDEVRNNLIVSLLAVTAASPAADMRWWTLGAPGECAIQTSAARPIVLGDLQPEQCARLAEQTRTLDYPGVVGAGLTAQWFADRAAELGLRFADAIPEQIQKLDRAPIYPNAPGSAREVGRDDVARFSEWLVAFLREAVPQDPVPPSEQMAKMAASGHYVFWLVDGEPVSMAGTVRRTPTAAVIAGVYTPPALRGRGYAGAVTAAVVERAFAGGKRVACLYTNLRNPASNRCYARIGFRPVCEASHYLRV
jgi:RimJ/RimL family protein N-acetyltransferase